MRVYIDMDSQKLSTVAYWTLFTCRESTQRSGLDWQGVLQRFRSHVDNCALLLAELEADGDSLRARLSKHILFSGPSSIDELAFAGRKLPNFQAQADTSVSRPLSLRVRLLERHVNPGGPVFFFSANGLVHLFCSFLRKML